MDRPASKPAQRNPGPLGWLGLLFARNTARSAPAGVTDAPVPSPDIQDLMRRQALHKIGEFLTANHLAVTRETLAAAFDCIAGGDPRLTGLIAERRAVGEPVTADWLAEVRRGGNSETDTGQLAHLIERLETNIDSFARTTHDARSATSEYQSALRNQVDELQDISHAGSVISEMMAIARTMIERTHEIEQQMVRSEIETRALHRSLDEARHSAEVDHLTGLPNRRAFEARLDQEFAAARAVHEPLCVAFCDIDRFKKINDTHGHDAGDRVLKVVARTLDAISDERCHVARHGGEEFVVLFRGLPLAQACAILDDARETLAERRLVNRANDQPFGEVTFSAGIADILDYSDPRTALKAADEALYVAKAEGRNRIVRAPARLAVVAQPNPRAA